MFHPQQFELLAPGGDLDSIKAAIAAGADAVYCGLDRFNARNRAANITLDQLDGVVELAHQHQCKLFLTLNIMLLEQELPAMIRLLNQLVESDVDGVIVQDLGLAYLLKRHFPSLDVHASTQMNTHNAGQIALLSKLGMSRVNVSRELNIDEITELAAVGREHQVALEVFVHGSYCIGFSGVCYFSSVRNGASGNRGRCSQPCRDQYQTTPAGKNFPLNLKDNSAFLDLPALARAGVYSLKVEGRIKKPHYVFTVVENWRKQIDHFCHRGALLDDMSELYRVFNRDFTNGYLQGHLHQQMFIDNPRNHAARHFANHHLGTDPESLAQAKRVLYNQSTALIAKVDALTAALPIRVAAKRSLKGEVPPSTVTLPVKPRHQSPDSALALTVLLADVDDLALIADHPTVNFGYQIPDALNEQLDALLAIFKQHPHLAAFFPAVVIGEHFAAAQQLLSETRPSLVVTDNLGVAEIAQRLGLNWVAGPQLNIANSLALECIASELGGAGAFISNELSQTQIKCIVKPQGQLPAKPQNFRLFYSVYHPMTLMTSRHCLLMQSVGCKKVAMNRGCLKRCEKSAAIVHLDGRTSVIAKRQASYNRLYGEHHYFNLAVLEDLPGRFSDVLIDLTAVATHSQVTLSKRELITAFSQAIGGDRTAQAQLQAGIIGTSDQQYRKGV